MPHFVAVLPLESLEVDEGFSMSAWPLHVTIVPTFSTDMTVTAVGDLFVPAPPAVKIAVGGSAMFGARENVTVALVEPSPVLVAAHRGLVSRLRAAQVKFDNPEYLDDGWRPHITATKRDQANNGERLTLTQLALVDMTPHGEAGLRRVVWTTPLDDTARR